MGELNLTNVMLDRYKTAFGLTSEYQLAKNLDVSHTNIYNWRKGRSQMDWDMAFKLADILQIPDQFVVFELLPHKIKNPRVIKVLEEARTR